MKLKLVVWLGLFALLFVSTASAGVMEYMKAVAGAEAMWIGIVTVVLLYVLKRIPNEKIQGIVGGIAQKLGTGVTLGLSKYKWTAPFWQKYVESYFIDLLNNTVGTFTKKFIEGLQSDNTIKSQNSGK